MQLHVPYGGYLSILVCVVTILTIVGMATGRKIYGIIAMIMLLVGAAVFTYLGTNNGFVLVLFMAIVLGGIAESKKRA